MRSPERTEYLPSKMERYLCATGAQVRFPDFPRYQHSCLSEIVACARSSQAIFRPARSQLKIENASLEVCGRVRCKRAVRRPTNGLAPSLGPKALGVGYKGAAEVERCFRNVRGCEPPEPLRMCRADSAAGAGAS